MRIIRSIIAFIMLAVGTTFYGQLMEAPEWSAEILEVTYTEGDTNERFTLLTLQLSGMHRYRSQFL